MLFFCLAGDASSDDSDAPSGSDQGSIKER